MCSCEAEVCLGDKKIENFEEVKSVVQKLKNMLNKHVFKSVIVKRSVELLEQREALVANGKDAKHDVELMLNIYDTIKQMLELSSDKDVEAFKSKLMSLQPEKEKKMTLRELIDELKATRTEEKCEHDLQTIECTPGTQLKIIKAAISNKNKFACPAMKRKSPVKTQESCYEEEMTTKLMNATCSGRQVCTVSVHRDFLNICKCAEQKYLELTYTCQIVSPEAFSKSAERQKRSNGGPFNHSSVDLVRKRTMQRLTTNAYDAFFDLRPRYQRRAPRIGHISPSTPELSSLANAKAARAPRPVAYPSSSYYYSSYSY